MLSLIDLYTSYLAQDPTTLSTLAMLENGAASYMGIYAAMVATRDHSVQLVRTSRVVVDSFRP